MSKHNRDKVKSGRISYDIYDDPKGFNLTNELKYTDTTISYGLASSAGSWTKLSLPSQGTTSTTRVADRAKLLKVECGFQFNVGGNLDMVRVVMLQTKGLFTSPPATTDLLSVAYPTAPYAYNARDLYEIVYDNLMPMSPQGDTAIRAFRVAIKPKIKGMKFVPGSVNVYDGQLYLLVIPATASNINYSANIRTWFEDGN